MKMDKALNIHQFAEEFGLKASTVATNVSRNPSSLPAFIKVGRLVRFTRSDINTWLETSKQH